jgi:hypothetical protein
MSTLLTRRMRGGGSWRLVSVGSVIWEFICTEFGVGQVQFKDGGKGSYEICLLL